MTSHTKIHFSVQKVWPNKIESYLKVNPWTDWWQQSDIRMQPKLNILNTWIPYSAIALYVVGENIGKFGELTAICLCMYYLQYQYFPYPNIFNRCLLLQFHTWTSACIVRLLLYLSFKILLKSFTSDGFGDS